jgi:RNA polymerase sigma factor (TIGR02999 family)
MPDGGSTDRLAVRVYEQLKRIAASYMRKESDHPSLPPTALVHEAYIRLAGRNDAAWKDDGEFVGVVAHEMRCVLVDHARRRRALKRPQEKYRLHITDFDRLVGSEESSMVDVLALDDALQRLETLSPRQVQVLEHRVFSGLSVKETAKALGVSATTVKDDWRMAKAWLRRELGAPPEADD